jgi:hypothetical protein
MGTLVDIGVWYYVKDLKIFDDEDEKIDEEREKEENISTIRL